MKYIHKFIKGNTDKTILLLHGTGADENDLIPIAEIVAPGFNILSPRGNVNENGMLRFFRRLGEGVFDEEDIKLRAHELNDFIVEASEEYKFDLEKLVCFGFSNGANMAAELVLLYPDVLKKAILLRPMIPLIPEAEPDLENTKILINAGKFDQMIPSENAGKLAELLEGYKTNVEINYFPTGHNLIKQDLDTSIKWISELF